MDLLAAFGGNVMSNPVSAELLPGGKEFSGRTVGDFLEAECLLPVQYNAMLRKRAVPEGESKLLLAVLKDALRAYIKNLQGRTRQAQRDFLEVEVWFNAKNQDGLFAYENVCDALGLEPEMLRKWLKSLPGAEPAARRLSTRSRIIRRPSAA
jgi:hypothetical protein